MKRLNSIESIMKDLRSLKFNIKSTIYHIIDNQRIKKEKNISKIYFSSGMDYRPQWLNIDVSKKADYWIDLRNKINIPDNSVDLIFSSHTVEHLEHSELVFHLKECFRILKIGGRVRVGIPNFVAVIKNYKNEDFFLKYKRFVPSAEFDGIPDELLCYMDLINRSFYEFGLHKTALDPEKLINLLIFSGFKKSNIIEDNFNEELDVPSRKEETLYVEAMK